MSHFVKPPDVPLGYTPVRDPKSDPLGSDSAFWDVPKLAGILMGIRDRLIRW